MAPTEILARQHYETISGPLTELGVGVILLTGRDKGAGRAEKLVGAGRPARPPRWPWAPTRSFRTTSSSTGSSWPWWTNRHRFGVSERQRLQDQRPRRPSAGHVRYPDPAHPASSPSTATWT